VRYRRIPCAHGPRLMFGVDGPNVIEHYDATFAAFADRADVTVFEPPGTGGSAPAPGFPFTFSALSDVTREVIRGLGLAPVTLVFPCYLGYVGALLSSEHRTVLVQTPSWPDMTRWVERVDRRGLLRAPVIGQLLMRARRETLARLWYRMSAGNEQRAMQLTDTAVDVLRAGGCFCLASLMQGLTKEAFTPSESTPKMLLWGSRDRSHRKSRPDEAWPGATIHYMPTGHSPELEEPSLFADTLLKMLDGCACPPPISVTP
jgi:pimeloyl-ACP methyl ester carboxylesterase